VRLGISPDQFEQDSARPLTAKKSDKRYSKFVEQWGTQCAEVEAIPATELRRILRAAIESHILQGEWARLKEIERLERETWVAVMGSLLGACP
jgi:hypothetical protein